MSQGLVIRVPQSTRLPDNQQYTNRFEIHSSSSSRVYIVAQHKSGGYWTCSCPGWVLASRNGSAQRQCKHLKALNLPGGMVPFDATLAAGGK